MILRILFVQMYLKYIVFATKNATNYDKIMVKWSLGLSLKCALYLVSSYRYKKNKPLINAKRTGKGDDVLNEEGNEIYRYASLHPGQL